MNIDEYILNQKGKVLVDLDGTLAHYDEWKGLEHIGEPVEAMLNHVKYWLKNAVNVWIFTARASHIYDMDYHEYLDKVKGPIDDWCRKHIGQVLPITCTKDFEVAVMLDDRAIQVQHNTGAIK